MEYHDMNYWKLKRMGADAGELQFFETTAQAYNNGMISLEIEVAVKKAIEELIRIRQAVSNE